MSIIHYEVYCNTEAKFQDWYLTDQAPVPTKCPSSDAHTIDPTKTLVAAPAPSSVSLANVQLDSDNAQLSRIKQAPTGYTYQLHCFELTTGTTVVVNKDYTNTDLNEITAKMFDVNNVLITDPSLYASQAVKSCFDFEPPYDFYIIGGEMRIASTPESDVRLSVVVAPDIPYIVGGSRPLIQSMNLRFLSPTEKVQADGRAAKQLLYNNPIPHTNKMRFIIYHDVGVVSSTAVFLEFYKA